MVLVKDGEIRQLKKENETKLEKYRPDYIQKCTEI
jgi:hypothetical protein